MEREGGPTRTAWILTGGWEGHQPRLIADTVGGLLRDQGFESEVVTSLERLEDRAALQTVDLIVPNWTQGQIGEHALRALLAAVHEGGSGAAGLHGGMGDAFRAEPSYQEMVGGQWVSHPGGEGVTYGVHIVNPRHPLTEALTDFTVTTEQYYLHIDPAVEVLATTNFGETVMPVAWTKSYGRGRVFYCALGHRPELLHHPTIRQLLVRGFTWAARRPEERSV